MARPEAVAKALYYPTQDRPLAMIGRIVRLEGSVGASMLDPCAGEGTAAATLAGLWNVRAYGVELHKSRAEAASKVLAWLRHGSYHQLTALTANGEPIKDTWPRDRQESPFGILLLNPPYDDGTDETGASMRQEIEFLRASARFLAGGGLLIYIVPRKILRLEVFRDYMRGNFRDIRAYAYPAPEVREFDQVVVFATRGSGSYYGNTDSLETPDTLPTLDTAEPYAIRVPVIVANMMLTGQAPETFAPAMGEGAWASQQWIAHTGDGAEAELAPLLTPRPGHQAMLLAAGSLNGLEIRASGRARQLVKGGSRKVTATLSVDNDTIVRERIVSYLSVLNLRTGILDSWQVEDEQTKTGDWFKAHGEKLAEGILSAHSPQFKPGDVDVYDFTGLRAPGVLPGRTEPEILPIQREAAAAIAHRWSSGHAGAILAGEQGVGKTTIGTVACELAKARKVVVVCPSHLTRKWAREIGIITGRPGVVTIARKLSDVDAFFASATAAYLIVNKEIAKLGARWEIATAKGVKRIEREVKRTSPHWPHTVTTEMVPAVKRFTACPTCGGEVSVYDKTLRLKCPRCQSQLWQAAPISVRGTKRWPMAAYIHDRYARRYTLVVDEAHQHSKGETDQARAVHQLMTGARKVLLMTGTVYGGRASSIFYTLYRIDPAFRRAYKHTDCATFVAHHGLFETVHKDTEKTSIYGYRKGNTGGRIREIPGMSPALIPLILPYTVFVKLADLRLNLPEYTEEVMLVEPDEEVAKAAKDLQEVCRKVMRKHPRALSSYLQACLGYPDCPEQAEAIYDITEAGGQGDLLASAPALPSAPCTKDTALIDRIVREHGEDRKVLVYFTQTKRRDARGRVRAALEAKGLRVVQLDSNVDPEKREQWMLDRCAEGFDVMLTNGALVETGLDLMFAHTIIQYGIDYSIPRIRQSVRRSWRLGQTKPIRVIFMAYSGTMQAIALNLIARKMRASEMVDGDAAGGLAQSDAGGGNFLLELAHEVLAA